jgi:tetratricopeptide (TPR) repeat protein
MLIAVSLFVNIVEQDVSLEQVILQGEQALTKGALDRSEEYLRLALSRATSTSSNALEKVRIQIDLSSLLTLSGRNVEAEEVLKSALSFLRTNPIEGKPYLPIVLTNLGAVYWQTGQYRKGEAVLNEAKDLLNGDASNINVKIDLLSNLGILYGMTGRVKLAQSTLEKAIALNDKSATGRLYLARTLTNLATLDLLRRKWNLAEPILVRAREVLETSLGPWHPDLSAVLKNLGFVYEAQKKFSQAEGVLRSALDIRTSVFGVENVLVAETKMHLGNVLTEEGRFAEAESLYSQSLQTQERLSGPRSPDVALVLEQLAKVLRLETDERAKAMEDRAKAIRKEQELIQSVH